MRFLVGESGVVAVELPPGTYDYQAQTDTYQYGDFHGQFTVEDSAVYESVTLNPWPTRHFVVQDTAGNPIPNINVNFGISYDSGFGYSSSGRSDENGEIVTRVRPDAVAWQTETLWLWEGSSGDINLSGTTFIVLSEVSERGTITFTGADFGDDRSSVTISLSHEGVWATYLYLFEDDSSATIEAPVGYYTWTATTVDRYVPQTGSFDLDDGADETISLDDWTLHPQLTVSFTDQNGDPVENVDVSVYQHDYTDYPVYGSGRSNADGIATLNVPYGEYEVSVYPPSGFEPVDMSYRSFSDTTQPWDFTLQSIQVQAMEGVVNVTVNYPEEWSGHDYVFITFTNASTSAQYGPYHIWQSGYPVEFYLPVGTYTWATSGLWFQEIVSTDPIVVTEDVPQTVTLNPEFSDRGSLRLNITMDPVAENFDARAFCVWPVGSTLESWCANFFPGEPVEFAELPVGDYEVQVPTWQRYLSGRVPVTIQAGQETVLDITWSAEDGAPVTFNVVWPDGEPELELNVTVYYENGVDAESVPFGPGSTSVTMELPYGTYTYGYNIMGYEMPPGSSFTVTEGGDNTVTFTPLLLDGGARVTIHLEPSRDGDSLEGAYVVLHGWYGSRWVRVDANNDAVFGTVPASPYDLELYDFEGYPSVFPATSFEVEDGVDVYKTVVWERPVEPTQGYLSFDVRLPFNDGYYNEYGITIFDEDDNPMNQLYFYEPGIQTITLPPGTYRWEGSDWMYEPLGDEVVVADGETTEVIVAPSLL
ncbi:MAG: Ig-like domain-containing protein, partial [Thermomicrobiales bacterium]|nr:Ig-like domain-containing protein [Thermomicrobiales bacterium]